MARKGWEMHTSFVLTLYFRNHISKITKSLLDESEKYTFYRLFCDYDTNLSRGGGGGGGGVCSTYFDKATL